MNESTSSTEKQTAKKKVTFQTIVATAETRASFTELRETMQATDKQLMDAVFKVATNHQVELTNALTAIRYEQTAAKSAAKAPKPDKPVKPAKASKAKKAVKPKANASEKTVKPAKAKAAEKVASESKSKKQSSDVAVVIEDGDDAPCLVVRG